MSIIKSIKQVLGLGPAAENHFWDGSVANQLTLKRGTPDAPGTEVMKIVDGIATFPNTVGFLATTVSDPANLLPSDGITKLAYGNVVRQVGSGYNNSTSVFTAPVSGVYMFSAAGFTHRDAVATMKSIRLVLSTGAAYLLESLSNDSASGRCIGAMPIYLNAGETIYAAYYHNEAGVNLYQGWNAAISYFTGYLIG